MGECIGLDFGTTYTMASILGTDNVPTAVKYDSTPYVSDSIVFRDEDDQIFYGKVARDQSSNPFGTFYSGFKMLLSEKDNSPILKAQNYDSKFSPAKITELFLDNYLRTATQDKIIDRLVVGVPAIWDTQEAKERAATPEYRNRNSLLNIISKFSYVKDVELYSEPELACGYYLDNFTRNMKQGQHFKGHLLLVDYGGGTLDIAVCEINNSGKKKVNVKKTFGAGWNQPNGQKGDAGLAFMQRLVEIAYKAALIKYDATMLNDGLYKIENAIINPTEDQRQRLVEVFQNSQICLVEKQPDGKTNYCRIICYAKGLPTQVPVTYGMIARAYHEVIEEVLTGCLEAAKKYMDDQGINWSASDTNDTFKIQLVGGFSNFYLVEKNVSQVFRGLVRGNDIRLNGGFRDRNDRNYAVAYGAALVANRKLEINKPADYSLGIYGIPNGFPRNAKGELIHKPFFAINQGETITPGQVYLFLNSEGKPMIFGSNKIANFAYGINGDTHALSPVKEYESSLKFGGSNYIFGLSFDRSMIISIHYWKVTGVEESKASFDKHNWNKLTREEQGKLVEQMKTDGKEFCVSDHRITSLDKFWDLTGLDTWEV